MTKNTLAAISQLDKLYDKGDVKKKRSIVGLIYSEMIVFHGFQYRTARFNEALKLIYSVRKGFGEKETGQKEENFDLSSLGLGSGYATYSYAI